MATEAEERAAAEAAGLDYDALTLASMLADYIRGEKPQLPELPFSARWLVTCYMAHRDGTAGIAVDSATGRRLDRVPHIDRRKYDRLTIENDVIEGEIVGE